MGGREVLGTGEVQTGGDGSQKGGHYTGGGTSTPTTIKIIGFFEAEIPSHLMLRSLCCGRVSYVQRLLFFMGMFFIGHCSSWFTDHHVSLFINDRSKG